MAERLLDLAGHFLLKETEESKPDMLTVVLIVGALVAVAAFTVLIISVLKLSRSGKEQANNFMPNPTDIGREAFYAEGETSARRTVIGAGMPSFPDSFSEQKTTGAANGGYGNIAVSEQQTVARPGTMPFSGGDDFGSKTVAVRDMHRAAVAVQPQPGRSSYAQSPAYAPAQQPYQEPNHADSHSTVNVRGQSAPQPYQQQSAPYGQPNPYAYGQSTAAGQQSASGIGELIVRYTIPGRSEQTQRFSQPREITIGRDSGNKLVIPYQCVSNHHARIDCVGSEVYITNVSHSVNGLQNSLSVDRRDVTQRTPLTNGCEINIGMVPMTVTWSVGGAAPMSGMAPAYPGAPMVSGLGPMDGMTVRPSRGVSDDWTVRGGDGMLTVSWELSGRRGSKRVNMQDNLTIGRDPSDTVYIEDTTRTVSKHHLLLTHHNGRLVVRNNSRVNPQYGKNPFIYQGQRVVDEVPFTDGMVIQSGRAMITLNLEGGQDA